MVCDTLLAYEMAVIEKIHTYIFSTFFTGRSRVLRTTDACEDG